MRMTLSRPVGSTAPEEIRKRQSPPCYQWSRRRPRRSPALPHRLKSEGIARLSFHNSMPTQQPKTRGAFLKSAPLKNPIQSDCLPRRNLEQFQQFEGLRVIQNIPGHGFHFRGEELRKTLVPFGYQHVVVS